MTKSIPVVIMFEMHGKFGDKPAQNKFDLREIRQLMIRFFGEYWIESSMVPSILRELAHHIETQPPIQVIRDGDFTRDGG